MMNRSQKKRQRNKRYTKNLLNNISRIPQNFFRLDYQTKNNPPILRNENNNDYMTLNKDEV